MTYHFLSILMKGMTIIASTSQIGNHIQLSNWVTRFSDGPINVLPYSWPVMIIQDWLSTAMIET